MLAILVMGFASGLPLALTGATLAVWMRQDGLSLTAIGLFALVGLAYNVKFLWAPLLDQVRLPWLGSRMGRRRSWTLFVQAALFAAIAQNGAPQPPEAVLALERIERLAREYARESWILDRKPPAKIRREEI